MKENSKCFIRVNKGIYEEITYKELEERRKKDSLYKEKKFIYIHGMLMEVSEKEYKEYYAEIEKNRYSKKVLQKLKAISIEELNYDENIKDKEVIEDKNKDTELEVERKVEIEQLKKALLQLESDEYEIIKEIFFNNKTVREYAKLQGIPYATIQYKKKKAIEKLKRFLKY